ncbi:MAG: hypothetical protein KAT49_05530 [Methanomicrobia archaeon]|nr:hypothetical protein [Methanomicrobia archaeon]MCK4637323.1 hypothetical protein [Methanomicrobia archaeon]
MLKKKIIRLEKTFLVILVVIGIVFGCCVEEEKSPTESPQQLKYPDKDTYIEEVVATLDSIDETLKIASQASRDLADDRITMEEFKEMAVLGKRNLEEIRVNMNSIVPPSEVILGKTTFEDMHDNLIKGIELYIKAFDEMIKYGNDGQISHIDKATNYTESGNLYINVVNSELRIVQKK